MGAPRLWKAPRVPADFLVPFLVLEFGIGILLIASAVREGWALPSAVVVSVAAVTIPALLAAGGLMAFNRWCIRVRTRGSNDRRDT